MQLTTETELLNLINSIKTKASGHDGMNVEMIKITLEVNQLKVTL